jgi:hypothetical protein
MSEIRRLEKISGLRLIFPRGGSSLVLGLVLISLGV